MIYVLEKKEKRNKRWHHVGLRWSFGRLRTTPVRFFFGALSSAGTA
jgi:hypothetical protein